MAHPPDEAPERAPGGRSSALMKALGIEPLEESEPDATGAWMSQGASREDENMMPVGSPQRVSRS